MRAVATGHYVACHFPLIGPQAELPSSNGRHVAPLPLA
jgi:hypothetical protein